MWDGKNKAITFSFDDGCQQDIELIEKLNKYKLKATFNLNSARGGMDATFEYEGKTCKRFIVKLNEIKKRYVGHEVAVHTLTHADLTKISDDDVLKEVNLDQKNLKDCVGYEVVGMAYPWGTYDERIIDLLKNKTTISYSRTAVWTSDLKLPKNPFAWDMFYWRIDFEKLDKIIDEFLAYDGKDKLLLAIWGHSYELDCIDGLREYWDKTFPKIANKKDIFYGTNKEVLGYN